MRVIKFFNKIDDIPNLLLKFTLFLENKTKMTRFYTYLYFYSNE